MGGAARALLALQMGVRLVTFVLNQLLVRTASPAVFGAANVQLELVLSIVLALARDGVRSVVMRRRDARVHNLALAPVAAGGVLALAVGGVYTAWLAPQALWAAGGAAVPLSVALYCAGALLELVAEPLHTYALALDEYVVLRVAMEAGGVLARALVTVLLLRPAGLAWLQQVVPLALPRGAAPLALIAFGMGRAAYGGVLLAVAAIGVAYVRSWAAVRRALWPVADAPVDRETAALMRVTTAQALLKLLLTEGDKLAVAQLTTLEDQGGYALASNYGSLVARTLFQPVEESARLEFSRVGGRDGGAGEPATSAAAALLTALLRVHVLLALGLVALGPPLAHPFVYVVAGARWAEPPSAAAPILASYCWYLPVMGINGVVEAFVQSVAPPDVLAWYSRVLVGASAAFVGTLGAGHALYAGHGAALAAATGVGRESLLVLANLVGLGVRAAASWHYVRRFFGARVRVESLLPSWPAVAVLGVCAAVLRKRLPERGAPTADALGVAAALLGAALATMYVVGRRS